MVMEVSVRNSHVVRGMREIGQTVVVVLVMVPVRRKVAMINPDIRRLLHANGIAGVRQDFADGQVLHNDVLGFFDEEADAYELGGRVET